MPLPCWCALGLATRHVFFIYLAFAVIGINIILTFTDQIGLPDWITVLIDLVILNLLARIKIK
jgi:hypothetical protein